MQLNKYFTCTYFFLFVINLFAVNKYLITPVDISATWIDNPSSLSINVVDRSNVLTWSNGAYNQNVGATYHSDVSIDSNDMTAWRSLGVSDKETIGYYFSNKKAIDLKGIGLVFPPSFLKVFKKTRRGVWTLYYTTDCGIEINTEAENANYIAFPTKISITDASPTEMHLELNEKIMGVTGIKIIIGSFSGDDVGASLGTFVIYGEVRTTATPRIIEME